MNKRMQKKLNKYAPTSIRIFNISYDTDGEEISLPDELVMKIPKGAKEAELTDLASDYISDTTGFCHNGFDWSTIQN